MLFEVLMAVRAVLGLTVFLHLEGRVHGSMQFGVLVLVVIWDAVWGAV